MRSEIVSQPWRKRPAFCCLEINGWREPPPWPFRCDMFNSTIPNRRPSDLNNAPQSSRAQSRVAWPNGDCGPLLRKPHARRHMRDSGLLRGTGHRAALCADPLAAPQDEAVMLGMQFMEIRPSPISSILYRKSVFIRRIIERITIVMRCILPVLLADMRSV
jgi:hypothetical protein